MKRSVFAFLSLLLLAAIPASIRPVKWSLVSGTSPRRTVAGKPVGIMLKADIAHGWHIYSLSQKPGGPIPLRIRVGSGAADVMIIGEIKAPPPRRAFDKNFRIETELYSGSPTFTVPVGIPANSLSGIRKFQIEARYQVCSETLCLPPRTDKMDATIVIDRRR